MVNINLIPVRVHRAQTCREHFKRWMISLAIGLLALGVSSGAEWARGVEAGELRGRAQQLQTNVEEARARLMSVRSKASGVLHQIERATALRAKRPWSGIFALIDSCMPEGCWLTTIATDPATPAARSRPSTVRAIRKPDEPKHRAVTIETPRKLRIGGYATEMAEPLAFVMQLEKRGVFTQVRLVGSQSEPILDGTYFKFEIVCEWQP